MLLNMQLMRESAIHAAGVRFLVAVAAYIL